MPTKTKKVVDKATVPGARQQNVSSQRPQRPQVEHRTQQRCRRHIRPQEPKAGAGAHMHKYMVQKTLRQVQKTAVGEQEE